MPPKRRSGARSGADRRWSAVRTPAGAVGGGVALQVGEIEFGGSRVRGSECRFSPDGGTHPTGACEVIAEATAQRDARVNAPLRKFTGRMARRISAQN